MIPTQNQILSRKANCISDTIHKSDEILRRHASVATELVDLITRSFNEDRLALGETMHQSCFQYERMGRTNRSYTSRLTRFLSCDYNIKVVIKWFQHKYG